MKRILVTGGIPDAAEEKRTLAEYAEFFQRSLGTTSIEGKVSSCELQKMVFDISPGNFSVFDTVNDLPVSDYDLIFFRGKLLDKLDLAFALCHFASEHNIPTVNDYRSVRNMAKTSQAVLFYLHKLPFPRTIFGPGHHIKDLITKNDPALPVIYKSKYGVHGNNNFLISEPNDFNTGLEDMILQEYIPNDCDYRVLVVGDKTLVIKRSAKPDTHLNNTSKGGSAELVDDFDETIIEESRRLLGSLNMTVAGVDVVMDKNGGEHYYLEINSLPQLKSGSFVKEKELISGELINKLLGGPG